MLPQVSLDMFHEKQFSRLKIIRSLLVDLKNFLMCDKSNWKLLTCYIFCANNLTATTYVTDNPLTNID